MQGEPVQWPWFLFPLAFAGLWGAVTTILTFMAGWPTLAHRYPNTAEVARLKLSWQSGTMGFGVGMRGVLTLSACPSGLRVEIWRVFGPFAKPFLVPWNEIETSNRSVFFAAMKRLNFGRPQVGKLTIQARIWERLVEQSGDLASYIDRPVTNAQLGEQWLSNGGL